jgi:hypothetical protein
MAIKSKGLESTCSFTEIAGIRQLSLFKKMMNSKPSFYVIEIHHMYITILRVVPVFSNINMTAF